MPHLLKRLELNGFKSFAQKTVLEFPDGITAIVGPNGSGKSNVIDAMRWLLGEREAKNLRGAKVEDLIFAGNHKRARLGQAHAGLHFDNKNQSFPVDFAEVSVVREVNRDGVSRYFLNKAEVRLKNIVNFFAHARIGTKGLVIITQGKSDIFIEASPSERREMIEEMLGLREYQIKKTDAERRLLTAESNLEKVKALLLEVEPHLRSLKRQTNRWEKREALQTELHRLERDFFGSQLRKLYDSMAAVEEDVRKHRKEREMLEEKRDRAAERLDNLEKSKPKEQEELRRIKHKTHEILGKRSILEKDIGRLEAQMEIVKNSEAAAAVPPERLIALLKKIRQTLDQSLHGDPASVPSVMKHLIAEIDAALAPPSAHGPVPDTLAANLARINGELAEFEAQLTTLAVREKAREERQEEFYKSFKAAAAEFETAKDEIKTWENTSRERAFEKERFEIRRADLEHQILQADRKPEDFLDYKLERELIDEELNRLERQILRHRGDLSAIGDVDEALLKEARETDERHQFLKRELKDLEHATADLKELISDLSEKISVKFGDALKKINAEFDRFFQFMFDGGRAKLKLTKNESQKPAHKEADESETAESKIPEDAPMESQQEKEEEAGIDIEVSIPRKRVKSLDALSGGERSLVGIAALFALISVSPPPFLVLDEIDAALDERNARRFAEMLKEFSKKIQFVVVTHNRVTMEVADVLYGVTMNEDGTSRVLSLKLEPQPRLGKIDIVP